MKPGAPMAEPPLCHIAGPLLDWVQRCTRCGYVLCDYRNASYLAGQSAPKGWAEGASVIVDGPGSWVAGYGDDAPPCGARA